MRALALTAVLFAAAWGGCLNDEQKPRLVELPGVSTGGVGTLAGRVTDVSFNPLPNVTVSLRPGDRGATTGTDGGFSFPDVAAGRYRAAFERPGFLAAARVAEVRAGNETRVDVQLTEAPSREPFRDVLPFEGFTECSLGLPATPATPSLSANCLPVLPPDFVPPPTNERHTFLFEAGENLSSLVVELAWDPGPQALASEFVLLLEQAGTTGSGGLLYAEARGPSPLRVEFGPGQVAEHMLGAGAALQVRAFVSGSAAPGVALQQAFEARVSLFYFAPHAAGYSAFTE